MSMTVLITASKACNKRDLYNACIVSQLSLIDFISIKLPILTPPLQMFLLQTIFIHIVL